MVDTLKPSVFAWMVNKKCVNVEVLRLEALGLRFWVDLFILFGLNLLIVMLKILVPKIFREETEKRLQGC